MTAPTVDQDVEVLGPRANLSRLQNPAAQAVADFDVVAQHRKELGPCRQDQLTEVANGASTAPKINLLAALIDEYQPVVQPMVLRGGLPLFKNITDRIDLKLLEQKHLVVALSLFSMSRQQDEFVGKPTDVGVTQR
jgi:hypothetical protein